MPTTRRSDAQRNRAKILDAAREAFADPSAGEVSMAELSRRAGVGMATLYRNFAGRRELLEALFTDEIDAVCAAAATVDDGGAGANLVAWLERFFDFYVTKRHVGSQLLAQSDSDPQFFSGGRARVIAAGAPLFAAARAAHEVREDLGFEQILDMLIAIAVIDRPADYLAPMLRATLDGLRPTT